MMVSKKANISFEQSRDIAPEFSFGIACLTAVQLEFLRQYQQSLKYLVENVKVQFLCSSFDQCSYSNCKTHTFGWIKIAR